MENYFYSSCASSSVPSSHTNVKEKKQKSSRRGNNGVKLSTDPQSVAARERRHRISDRFKILQSLVPGGSKMDTVSMLEEAINYVKFLKSQILLHQTIMNFMDDVVDPLVYLNSSCYYNNGVPSCSSSLLPPQQQQLEDNLVGAAGLYLQPSTSTTSLLPLPDSFFQDQETVHQRPFDRN